MVHTYIYRKTEFKNNNNNKKLHWSDIYIFSKNNSYQSSPESNNCKCLHCTHTNVCDAFVFWGFLFEYQTNIISAGIYSVLLSIGTQLVQICSGDADVTFVMSIKLFALN